MLRRARCAAVFVLVLAGLASAQGTTSRVLGQVVDATGAVLPGATVTLTNERTTVNFTMVTTAAGTYAFEAVQVGVYTVKVELQGFKTFVAAGVAVQIGQPATVNAKLEPGNIAETVNVTAAALVVETNTSGNLGTVVDQKTIESLPIVGTRGRNPLDLVTLQPGVVSGANTGGGTHVYGARDRSWNFTLDGIDVNESSAGGSNYTPLRTNPDMLVEFKVLTGNQTAEYGRNSGGQVAMITRSGTNQFRGTGFFFWRDPSLNAQEWEYILVPTPKDQYKQKIGGFSLGGPIKKNKTFFFGNLQVLRATRTREQISTTYTDLARQGLWRYVVGGRNYPAGLSNSTVDANGNVLPGINVGTYNVVSNDPLKIGLSPDTQKLIALMPSPNYFYSGDGLNTAGYRWFPVETEKQYDSVIKIDQVISNNHYVYGRVAWGQQNTFADTANTGLPPYPGVSNLVDTYRKPFNLAASWRWTVKPTIVNEFVAGANYFNFDFRTPDANTSVINYDFGSITMPVSSYVGNSRRITTYQFVDNITWVKGAHALKFGTNMRFQKHNDVRGSIAGYNATPALDFSTSVNTVDPTLFNLPKDMNTANDRPLLQNSINFLLGRVGNVYQGFVSNGSIYEQGGSLFLFDAHFDEIDFFAQDTWKLRQNVTIDAGVRWEMKLAPTNPEGLIRAPSVRVAAGEGATSSLTWVKGPLYKNDLNNVAPSIGVAWDPTGNGKSVLRGNYRMAFDRINTYVLSSSIFQSIPGITAGINNTAYGQSGGRLSGVGAVVAGLQPTFTPDSFLTPPATSSSTMRVVDNTFQTPMTHAWALSYQHEIMKQTVVEVAYIGRRADHLFGAYNINQVEYRTNGFLDAFNIVQAGGQSPLMNQLLYYDTRRSSSETGSDFVRRQYPTELQQNGVARLASLLGTRIQSGKTLPELAGFGSYFFFNYPQFLGGLNVIDSNDWSRYNALVARLERRYAGGFLQLAYTLAKSMDTRSFDPAFTTVGTANSQSASSTPFDIYNRALNYAPSDFDRRHSVNFSWALDLPFGQGKAIGTNASGALNQIISQWDIAGTLTWYSGRPFTVYSGNYQFSNIVQTPANCTGCSESMGTVYGEPPQGYPWYFTSEERANFSFPAAGQFSNVGRNAFRGPSYFVINLTVSKRFNVYKGQTFEVRGDATNLTNTVCFGFPTATYTSTTFGRIYSSTTSGSRKIQIGVKYAF
ncbi:MAG: carboxypeptidase regulatory-like domain-containing protein [Bacteroidales bacterium]